MKHRADEDLDGALRAAYDPDPEVVRRTVSAALLQGAYRPRRWAPTLAFAALLLVCLILFRQFSPVQPDTYRLDYVGGVAVLQYPDGTSWLVTPDAAGENAPAGLNLIVVGGDQP
jgi:hypothetical protein